MKADDGFGEFFRTATGFAPPAPYDYQRRLAEEVCADGPKSLAINVPTGAGKTAVARSAWNCERRKNSTAAHQQGRRSKRSSAMASEG